ncbi:MAG: thymidylate synthase, partial [Deltaproteobacteria bacterium]
MANDRNVDEQYRSVLRDVLKNGVTKSDRTGTGTKSVFGSLLRFDMAQGFPLVTLKKTNFRPIVHELLWMLDSVDGSYAERGFGPHNIKYLCDNDVAIWNEWPYKRYVEQNTDLDYLVRDLDADGKESYRDYTLKEFAAKVKADDAFAHAWGGLGPVYGQQWRYWADGVDQVQDAIDQLRSNPDSRRIMVSAWNPSDLPEQLLPPCHYGFQYWSREMDLGERLAAAGRTELQV